MGDVSELSESDSEKPAWFKRGLADNTVTKRKRKAELEDDCNEGAKKLKAAKAMTAPVGTPPPVPHGTADKRRDAPKPKKLKSSKRKEVPQEEEQETP